MSCLLMQGFARDLVRERTFIEAGGREVLMLCMWSQMVRRAGRTSA